MIETLLGSLLGGAFRPAQRMNEIGAGTDAAWNVGAIETLRWADYSVAILHAWTGQTKPCGPGCLISGSWGACSTG